MVLTAKVGEEKIPPAHVIVMVLRNSQITEVEVHIYAAVEENMLEEQQIVMTGMVVEGMSMQEKVRFTAQLIYPKYSLVLVEEANGMAITAVE